MPSIEKLLVDRIYEAAVVPERWSRVLDEIAEVAGSAGGMMINRRQGSALWTSTENMRVNYDCWFSDGWHDQNIWGLRIAERRPTKFFDEDDLFAAGELDDAPMYAGFARPRGYGWSAGAYMRIPTGETVHFRFDRRSEDGPMRAVERARLDRLRPHLARASLLFSRLGIRQSRTAVEALETMGVPAAVLSRDGRILASNAGLDALLSQVTTRARGRIAFVDGQAQSALREALAHMGAGLFGQMQGAISIPATEQHPAAVAYLIPVQRAAQHVFGYDTMILMIRPEQRESQTLNLVRMLGAVGPGEAHDLTDRVSLLSPRLTTALLTSKAGLDTALETLRGSLRNRREEKLATYLASLNPAEDLPKPLSAPNTISAW